MSTGIVTKNPQGAVIDDVYNKWATIDVMSDPLYHDGLPIRLRIDLIVFIRPYSIKNPDGSYTYLTQITTVSSDVWYVTATYDVTVKNLLNNGWGNGSGNGSVQPYVDPNDPNAHAVAPLRIFPSSSAPPFNLNDDPTLTHIENAVAVAAPDDSVEVPTRLLRLVTYLRDYIAASNSSFKPGFWGNFSKWRENRRVVKEIKAYTKQAFVFYQLPATNKIEGNSSVSANDS